MKKTEKLTAPARKALSEAFSAAAELGSSCVCSEHLLLGLMRDEENPAIKSLSEHGLTAKSLSELVTASTAAGAGGELPFQGLSVNCRRILARAAQEAAKRGRASVAAEHILLSILFDPDCMASKLLKEKGTDPAGLANGLPIRV